MTTESAALDKGYRTQIRATPPEAARRYLFQRGYFYGMPLPEFILPSGFEHMTLSPTTKWRWTTPIYLLAPKGETGWRRFTLLHPYAYWHLVNTTTSIDYWEHIRQLLGRHNGVACYTLPNYRIGTNPIATSIKVWIQFERDLVSYGEPFTHLAVCDISSFYPSIYTHSIAWALHGKAKAKANRGRIPGHGDRIDQLFQAAREGQTNGLPIGNLVSDLFAEVILSDIDKAVTEELGSHSIAHLAARFRDDYRILCSSESHAKRIIRTVSRMLHEQYDLSLNDEKTHVYSDVVAASTRPWQAAIQADAALAFLLASPQTVHLTGSQLTAALLSAYHIQRAHPNGRPAVSILNRLGHIPELGAGIHRADIEYALGILQRLMSLREEVTPPATLLVDVLLQYLQPGARRSALTSLRQLALRDVDNHFRQMWLLRLALHYEPGQLDDFAGIDSPLIRLILGPVVPDVSVFHPLPGLSEKDQRELRNFQLVDRSLLEDVKGSPIPTSAVSAFSYSDPPRA